MTDDIVTAPHFIDLMVTEGKYTTIAQIEIMDVTDSQGEPYIGIGESRRHPDDKPDPLVGQDLAIGRALEDLAKRFKRQAEGRVVMNDHNREHSRLARKARQAREHDRRAVSRSRQMLRDRRAATGQEISLPHYSPPAQVREAISRA